MSIELRQGEIEHVYAWIVVQAAPQHILAVFYRNRDAPELHCQYRVATKTEPGQTGMDREKTFRHWAKDVDDPYAEMKKWGDHFADALGASAPYTYPVDGDVDLALRILDAVPGVEGGPVH